MTTTRKLTAAATFALAVVYVACGGSTNGDPEIAATAGASQAGS